MEAEIKILKNEVAGVKDVVQELKAEIKLMTQAVQRLSAIEDKLQADRESRALLWSKYEMIDNRLRILESETEYVREHRKVFGDHCKMITWCEDHKEEFEAVKRWILGAAITSIVAIGGLAYSLFKAKDILP
jgi:predicted RNase H-like nuclease (RuvC/YqgF family)